MSLQGLSAARCFADPEPSDEVIIPWADESGLSETTGPSARGPKPKNNVTWRLSIVLVPTSALQV
jgi:hypothetical protein